MCNHSLRVFYFMAIAFLGSANVLLAQAKAKTTPAENELLLASIHKLRSAKFTLEKADHDYGGHRGAAVHAVKTATHELFKALEHANIKHLPKSVKDFDSTHPPQVLSNKELAATIPDLKQAHKVLAQGDFDYGGHRSKAVTELGTAITQLEKALVYIKGKKTK